MVFPFLSTLLEFEQFLGITQQIDYISTFHTDRTFAVVLTEYKGEAARSFHPQFIMIVCVGMQPLHCNAVLCSILHE